MSEPLLAKGIRFALFILRELKWPLLFLVGLVLVGGGLFAYTMRLSYGAACYTVFMLTLAEPTIVFPEAWYNQALFYLIPLLGLGAIADSLVRLGYLIFSSKRKLQEWWIMEASTYRNHVVVCGLGRVGYRIVRELLTLKEPVVVIERNRESAFIEEILDASVPLIHGEIRLRKNLENANVDTAKAIILATDDDLANLDGALTAREINPGIRVVMRLFDETLANKVASSFKLPALSTSQVAAPAFVAAATGRAVFHSFQLEGETIHVADLNVAKVASRSVAGLQKEFGISVVCHKSARAAGWSPNPEPVLQTGDTIVVVAAMEKIQRLEAANRG